MSTPKLKNGAVSAPKLRANAVTSPKLAPGAVRAADLGAGSVGTSALANGAVDAVKIAGGAVGGPALANGSVTNEKLGPNAVTGAEIAGGTITAENVAPGQLLSGRGGLVSARVVLSPTIGGPPSALRDLPGIASFSVSCPAGGTKETTIRNASAALLTLIRSAIDGPSFTPVAGATALGPGGSTGVSSGAVQVSTWQLSYTDPAGMPHVATAVIATSQAGSDCVWTGQALTTG